VTCGCTAVGDIRSTGRPLKAELPGGVPNLGTDDVFPGRDAGPTFAAFTTATDRALVGGARVDDAELRMSAFQTAQTLVWYSLMVRGFVHGILLLTCRSRLGTVRRRDGISRRHRRFLVEIWFTEMMRTLRPLVHFSG